MAAAERVSEALSRAPGLAVNSRIYQFSRNGGEKETDNVKEYFSDTNELMRKIFCAADDGKSGGAAAENNMNSDNTVQVRTDAVIFVSAAGIAVIARFMEIVKKMQEGE